MDDPVTKSKIRDRRLVDWVFGGLIFLMGGLVTAGGVQELLMGKSAEAIWPIAGGALLIAAGVASMVRAQRKYGSPFGLSDEERKTIEDIMRLEEDSFPPPDDRLRPA